MGREEWAFAELDARRREDARWPVAPHPYSDDWQAYARSRWLRARRRKERGYSRKAADDLVAWAEAQERVAA